MKFLFQGDSVTDCSRDRNDPLATGNGYVSVVAKVLRASADAENPTIYNRGISGNRVRDLKARWEEDCLMLKPDVLSILIGINDVWRQFDQGSPMSYEEVRGQYRGLIERATPLAPKLILMEPFLIPTEPAKGPFRPVLDPLIQIVCELALEFGATLVPLDGLFAAACTWRPAAFWAADGIHPTPAGHRLIADAWLEAWHNLQLPEPPISHFDNLTEPCPS